MLKENNKEHCSLLGRFNKCFILQGPRGYKGSAGKPGRPGFIGPPGPTVSPPDEFSLLFQTQVHFPQDMKLCLYLFTGTRGRAWKTGAQGNTTPSSIRYKSTLYRICLVAHPDFTKWIFKCFMSSFKSSGKKSKVRNLFARKYASFRHRST